MKSYIQTLAEKRGFEGRSYMEGWFDALRMDEGENEAIFEKPVYIPALDIYGTITGIFIGRTYGIEYKVRYYIDGNQNETYFYSNEIKEKK